MFNDMLASIESIAVDLTSRVNPSNGDKLVSNWITQTFGNRDVSADAVWVINGDRKEVSLRSWQPARYPDADMTSLVGDGESDRGQAGKIRSLYASRSIHQEIAEAEVLKVATYLVASFMTGLLPSAKRLSVESTVKASILDSWMQEYGLELESLTLINGDLEDEKSPAVVEAIKSVFLEQAEKFKAWDKNIGRGGNLADDAEAWLEL
jgi:hypothetical protein